MAETKIEDVQLEDVYQSVDHSAPDQSRNETEKRCTQNRGKSPRITILCYLFTAVFVFLLLLLFVLLAFVVLEKTSNSEDKSCDGVQSKLTDLEKAVKSFVERNELLENLIRNLETVVLNHTVMIEEVRTESAENQLLLERSSAETHQSLNYIQSAMLTPNNTNKHFKNISEEIDGFKEILGFQLESNKEDLSDFMVDMWIGSCSLFEVSEWITIQRRTIFDTSFDRTWEEYENGFGNYLTGDFWLGLRSINFYLKHGIWVMRTDFETWTHETHWIEFTGFSVGDASSEYILRVGSQTNGSFTGGATNGWKYHDGMKFTTKDNDNDKNPGNCAIDYRSGGWWYNYCDQVNLNSEQAFSASDENSNRRMEHMMNGVHVNIKWSIMKIKLTTQP